ncbi:MAG TPA: histidine kinase dimerization/phosphoacceptor domain -containing protein, partial [Acidisarcina sp.]
RGKQQVVGKCLREVIPTHRLSGILDLYKQVMKTGRSLVDEFAVNVPGVNASWIERHVARLGDGLAITARNVSARRRTECKVAELTERLSLANDAAGIAVWDWNLKSNEIGCDPTMYRIWKMNTKTNRFDDWAALVHPEDLPLVKANLQKAIREKGHTRTEFRIVLPDGRIRHIAAAQGVLLDEEGEVARVIGMNTDISEKVEAELKLADSLAFTRSLLTSSPFCTILCDIAGKIVAVNRACESMLGYSESELLGQDPLMFHDGKEVASRATELSLELGYRVPADISVLMAKQGAGLSEDGEWTYIRKDGSRLPVRLTVYALNNSLGEVTGYKSIADDISDRVEKEQSIRAALHEKNVLLGEIHHRVKNNLQIVYSLIDLQCGRLDDAVVLASMRDCQHRVRSMALIHQTLYQSNDFAQVDFGAFLTSLVPTLIESYVAKSERIVLTIDSGGLRLPIDVSIPCGLLVNELISNSLKHAFPDGRQGRITVKFIHLSDRDLELSVSDDGIGIPEGLELTETDSLGLQLVFLLTEQIGGRMDVHRADPTSFVLHFRLKDHSTGQVAGSARTRANQVKRQAPSGAVSPPSDPVLA